MASSHSRDNGSEGSHVEVLTQIDWAALFEQPDDPGDTLMKIAEQWGCSKSMTRDRVNRMVRDGLLIKGKAVREDIAGRKVLQNVYRPTED